MNPDPMATPATCNERDELCLHQFGVLVLQISRGGECLTFELGCGTGERATFRECRSEPRGTWVNPSSRMSKRHGVREMCGVVRYFIGRLDELTDTWSVILLGILGYLWCSSALN